MFKNRLNNQFEIATYIEETSSKLVDKQLIEEYFFGCNAILQKCLVENLVVEGKDHHLPDKVLERKYVKLPLETMPPLVVENYKVIDGNHRYRILKQLGVKNVKIYQIES